jgi:hypothetical protein
LRNVPSNFHCIEAVREKYYLGSGFHTRCSCKARSTGQQCKNPAAFGTKVCKMHGARREHARRNQFTTRKAEDASCPPEAAIRLERRYLCSLALSDDLNALLGDQQATKLAKINRIERVSARGRALHNLASGRDPE